MKVEQLKSYVEEMLKFIPAENQTRFSAIMNEITTDNNSLETKIVELSANNNDLEKRNKDLLLQNGELLLSSTSLKSVDEKPKEEMQDTEKEDSITKLFESGSLPTL